MTIIGTGIRSFIISLNQQSQGVEPVGIQSQINMASGLSMVTYSYNKHWDAAFKFFWTLGRQRNGPVITFNKRWWSTFTRHSTLRKILAFTLLYRTGQVVLNVYNGVWEFGAVSFWAGSSCPRFYMGSPWEPKGLNQTGWWTKTIKWKRLKAGTAQRPAIHSLRSAILTAF